jgi:hypothetical protein
MSRPGPGGTGAIIGPSSPARQTLVDLDWVERTLAEVAPVLVEPVA